VALILTLIVFLFLPEYSDRIGGEFMPLLRALAGSATLAALAGAAFYGEVRGLSWRRAAQGALALALGLLIVWIWPR
jgi:hypothetical protein